MLRDINEILLGAQYISDQTVSGELLMTTH